MTDRIFSIGQSGLDAAEERVKSMMNNMVNVQTPGFKRSDVVQVSFPTVLESEENRIGSMKPQVLSPYYNHASGALIRTGNPTDVALGGKGFFVLQCPWGQGLTRDGRFIVNKEGQLVSASGNNPVMGTRGPIIVPPGSDVEITSGGQVKVEGAIVDDLKVVDMEDKTKLESVSGSVFKLSRTDLVLDDVSTPTVISGFVESSNISMVDEMMSLVQLSRLYSINAKIVETRDLSLAKAAEMGKMQ